MASLAPGRTLHDRYSGSRTTPATRRRRWRWLWAGVAIAAAVAVGVVDFPVHATNSYRRATLAGYLKHVASDVAQCRVGLHDAVVAYVGSIVGKPAVGPGIPALFASQGIAVCGFDNAGVVDLGQTQPPRSISTQSIDHIAPQVDAWAYLDAFTLLQDLRQVIAHPHSRSARAAFASELHALSERRQRVRALVSAAEHDTGVRGNPVALTSVVSLLPGGRLPTPRPTAS